MQNSFFFNEEQLRFIENTLKVTRKELIETIQHFHVSPDKIVAYLKDKNAPFRKTKDFI